MAPAANGSSSSLSHRASSMSASAQEDSERRSRVFLAATLPWIMMIMTTSRVGCSARVLRNVDSGSRLKFSYFVTAVEHTNRSSYRV